MYETALNWIEARRLERQLERLDAQLPFESPERQVSLIAEKRRVFDELRKRYPRYKIAARRDRKSTRLNSSHLVISYAVFCLKKKKNSNSPGLSTIAEGLSAPPARC